MHRIGGQARELRTAQMQQRLVVAGFHIDFRLLLDAFLDDEIKAESGSVTPLPKGFGGVKGEIKSTVRYVLAAPIRNEDGTNWGVVDFDAINIAGERLLRKEKIAHSIILRLARHLSGILAH